jgi:hypothetical protein
LSIMPPDSQVKPLTTSNILQFNQKAIKKLENILGM